MLAFDTIEIAVEDTGVAGVAKKNKGIGEGFEEGLYGSFECLVGLGVVIHYQRLIVLARV